MSFNFIPKTEKDVLKHPSFKQTRDDITRLMGYLSKKYPATSLPLALDPAAPTKAKITRRLTPLDLSTLKRQLSIKLSLSFGEGSRATGGSESRVNLGTQFEKDLVSDIQKYIRGDKISNTKNEKFINEFVKYYRLTVLDRVRPMGELNQKRPLLFSGSNVFIGTTGDPKIGMTVTDITVEGSHTQGSRNMGRTIYLSLKYGNKVTFANLGVTTIFPVRDFENNKLTSHHAKAILSMFGINEKKFIDTFNAYAKGQTYKDKENTFSKIDRDTMRNFIMSGIGYGYHMVHLLGGSIKHKEMTKAHLDRVSTPTSCTVYYGGIGADKSAKRIDMIVETSAYTLQFNIRSKSSGKIYPTHLMIDYEYK